ncbi:hypothetical protein HYALB_00009992 [Hymenoscyphus albidus]|uniref:Uncharacterized protein n=1 Tax=Hymenoscyphus albidus TaxID=595503 RepID=A0A9N9QBK3_9HELO|nr:hypothetical protein HYALB_00009992 [Hymenoscyphus albidus]
MASPTPQSENDATSTIYPESYYSRHHLYSYNGTIDCFRVIWPIFAPISENLIANDATDPLSATRPYFDLQTQTFHPISKAYVTHLPASTMSFRVQCLGDYQSYVDDCCICIQAYDLEECQCRDRDIDVDPLIVSNPRGVTIGNVVSAGSNFFAAHKRSILIAESFDKKILGIVGGCHGEDEEGNIKPLPENSRLYLKAPFLHSFVFKEDTGNGATLDTFRGTTAEWAMRVKKKGYTVFAAGEVPERVIGRIDATPMTD